MWKDSPKRARSLAGAKKLKKAGEKKYKGAVDFKITKRGKSHKLKYKLT